MKSIAKATLVTVLLFFAPISIAVALELNQAIENCRTHPTGAVLRDGW
jgi:hypothetical protein